MERHVAARALSRWPEDKASAGATRCPKLDFDGEGAVSSGAPDSRAQVRSAPDKILHFTVGRDGRRCDVVLEHPTVSAVHAEISLFENGDADVVDRGSRNGVSVVVDGVEQPVSSRRIPKSATLRLGDVVLSLAELVEAAQRRRHDRAHGRRSGRPSPPPPPARQPTLLRCRFCGAIKSRNAACAECHR